MALLLRCPDCQKFTIPQDNIAQARVIQEDTMRIVQKGEPLICTVCYKDGKPEGKRCEMVEEHYIPPDPPLPVPSRVVDIVIINGEPHAKWFTERFTPPPGPVERYQLALPHKSR